MVHSLHVPWVLFFFNFFFFNKGFSFLSLCQYLWCDYYSVAEGERGE